MSDVRPLPTPGQEDDAPWYGDGLKFTCQEGCTACCTGSGGYVWVTNLEIDAIATHLGIDRATFKREYCDRYGKRWSIKERKGSGDCWFLADGKGCTIYPVRPKQCRTFPFWAETISSPQAWESTAEDCPGCNQGELHTPTEIEARASVATGRRAMLERLYMTLREIYEQADQLVTESGGTCELSSRCCDLASREQDRHITSVEAAFLTEDREWDPAALDEGACPFLEEGRCSAHADRPLACRVYSCAEPYERDAHAKILERFRAEIKRLEPMFGIELEEGELRDMLRRQASLHPRANPVTGER